MTATRRDIWLTAAVVAGWTCFVIVWQWGGVHYDLNAIYVAGHFLASGRPDLVYAIDTATFPLSSDPQWAALSEAWDCGRFCAYPYLYPPLWAGLAAPLTRLVDYHAFSNAALLIQIPLFALSPVLAWRLWRPQMGLAKWTFRCLFLATLCAAGTTALPNNQPQLLVTFLLLLAFERSAHDRPWQGGVALGLAAAIKLYPALFALIWLARGNWRALGGFAATGLAALALNFALAPMALQSAFLDGLTTISQGVFPAAWNHSLTGLLGWFDPNAWDVHAAVSGLGPAGRLAAPALLVAGLGLLWWRVRDADALWRRRMLLPALVALSTLASPIGWSYYLFIALFAIQLLPEHYGAAGRVMMLALAALTFLPGYILLGVPIGHSPVPAALGAAFALLVFLATALAPQRGTRRADYFALASTA